MSLLKNYLEILPFMHAKTLEGDRHWEQKGVYTVHVVLDI